MANALVSRMESEMRKLIAIVVVFVVLFTVAKVQAGLVLESPQSYGQISQYVYLNGFNAYVSAENTSEWNHTWIDSETGEIYSHMHEQQSSGGLGFNLDQGFMGKRYSPIRTEINVSRWNDFGDFRIEASFVISTMRTTADWIAPPQIGMNWSLFDINYNVWASVRHGYEWTEDSSIQTNDIVGDAYFTFYNSEVKNALLNIGQGIYWENNMEIPTMNINASFDVKYLGSSESLKMFNASIPFQVIPEPATIALLSFGLLIIRKIRS